MQDDLSIVKKFFESYQRVWLATRDGRQIAKFYHTPCLSLRGDGAFVCFNTPEDVAQFFQSAADNYYRQGWERFALEDLSAESLGSRSLFTTMTWQALKSDGILAKEWKQSYNLCRFDKGWEIVLSTFHVSD